MTHRSDRKAGKERNPSRPGAMAQLRRYFFTGVMVTAPTGLTLYIVWAFVDWTDRHLKPLIPEAYLPGVLSEIPGTGLLATLLVLTMVGFLASSLMGLALVRLGERILAGMPVVRSLYGTLKQVIETFIGGKSSSFRSVVLVEFPRPGLYALAFVSSDGDSLVADALADRGDDFVTLYLPTALNPTSGYMIVARRSDVRPLDLSVEEAMKMVISGGVIVPKREGTAPAATLPAQENPAAS